MDSGQFAKTSWLTYGLLLGYLLASMVLVCLPHAARDYDWSWQMLQWIIYGGVVAALLLAGCALAWWCRRSLGGFLHFTPEDDQPASRLAVTLAIAFVVLQAVSAVIFDRPDWDDCYYLAAVLDYQQARVLNIEEPTHREGFPVSAINRLLNWELWGAVLCYLSGLNPMAVFHTLLPGVLVLLAYAAYWQVLAEYLPRRWVPLALLGLAAYHVWGISSHDTPANYLLTRIGQGKAVLLHLALPLITVTLTRFARQPSLAHWLSLLACVLFGLGASSSAVFLEIMLVSCLTLALLLAGPRSAWRRTLLGAGAVCLPPMLYGLLIRQAVMSDAAISPYSRLNWHWQTGLAYLDYYLHEGCAETFWLLLLPLLWLLLQGWRRSAYLVLFPVLLLATFCNPLLADPVAFFATSYATYSRVFWLLPVAPGLGVVLALLARLTSPQRQQGLLPPQRQLGLTWFIILAGLALSWCLPGLYVWSQRNLRIIVPHGKSHPLASNLLKMPPDLIPIADHLLADPAIRQVRILCGESLASYLTPYSRDFRFVQTRPLYTLYMTDLAGRRSEGEKRYLLTLLLWGLLPQDPDEEPLSVRHPYYPVPPFPDPPLRITPQVVKTWLDELHVKYVVIESDAEPTVSQRLQAVGFRPALPSGKLTLWVREGKDSCPPEHP